MTEGRLPKPAEVQVQVVAGSMLGGSATWGPLAYESVQAAAEQLLSALAEAASRGAAKYAATARLQNMMGEVRQPLLLQRRSSAAVGPNHQRCTVKHLTLAAGTPRHHVRSRAGALDAVRERQSGCRSAAGPRAAAAAVWQPQGRAGPPL